MLHAFLSTANNKLSHRWATIAAHCKEIVRANPADHAVLVELARKVGLDAEKAQQILDADTYAVARKSSFTVSKGSMEFPP